MTRRAVCVDWFRILAELRRAGLSQCEVARQLDLPRNRVKHWANGKSPRYEDGRALLLLWRRAMLKKNAEVTGAPRHEPNKE